MNEMREYLVGNAGPVLFLIVFAEQIGLPIPAAPILVAAGALVADGTLSPWMAMLVTIVASLLADVIWFYLGWYGGDRMLRFLRRIFCYEDSSFARTERLFAKYDVPAVTAAKFLPWLGVVIPPLAGAFKMNFGKFLRFDLLGSILYGLVYIGLGVVFSAEVNGALELLGEVNLGTVTLIAALIVILFAWKKAVSEKGYKLC